MLCAGASVARPADSVSAAVSIAETSASRVNMMTPASTARLAAAKISPTVPREPPWAMP